MALPSVWRSEFAGEPTCSFSGFHRIDKLDNALVDVITSGTLERSNVKASGARSNARQHGSCLARWAKWPQDHHDASPWIRREHNTLSHRYMPIRDGDEAIMEPRPSWRCSILLTFEKLMYQRGAASIACSRCPHFLQPSFFSCPNQSERLRVKFDGFHAALENAAY